MVFGIKIKTLPIKTNKTMIISQMEIMRNLASVLDCIKYEIHPTSLFNPPKEMNQ